jgi:ubiquinone/menaquinone biosynthesis C-methylase UbiE
MHVERPVSPVLRSHQQARVIYDRISGWYDALEGRWERRPIRIGLRVLGAREGESVLEIGFGTGHSVVAFARAVGVSGMVHGVDLSPRMLALARSRVERAGLQRRVRLENADAVSLPLRDSSVDAVFMSFVLELFDTPEIPVVLRECRRVLRDPGRICVVSLSRAGGPSFMRAAYEWGHRRLPRLLDCRPIFAGRAMEAAGFGDLRVTRVKLWGLPVEVALGRKHVTKERP